MHTKKDYHQYLEELATWGVTNMPEAAPYLIQHFPELSLEDARKILVEYAATKPQLLTETHVV